MMMTENGVASSLLSFSYTLEGVDLRANSGCPSPYSELGSRGI